MESETPQPGDIIYINSSLFLADGEDDIVGGLATVVEVEERASAGRVVPFVRVEENPGAWYNWEYLEPQQEELEKYFRDSWAYRDPDYRPEFNHWD